MTDGAGASNKGPIFIRLSYGREGIDRPYMAAKMLSDDIIGNLQPESNAPPCFPNDHILRCPPCARNLHQMARGHKAMVQQNAQHQPRGFGGGDRRAGFA